MDAARAAETAEESVVAAKVAAAVGAEASNKSAEKRIHVVWSDHIVQRNKKMKNRQKQQRKRQGTQQ